MKQNYKNCGDSSNQAKQLLSKWVLVVLLIVLSAGHTSWAYVINVSLMSSGPIAPMSVKSHIAEVIPQSAQILDEVPTSSWTYGCSPTAAGMIFGYYDRISYSNMYSGPANGGLIPLTDIGNQSSIIATQNGFDGRTTNGQENDGKETKGDDSNFKRCWNRNSCVLGNMFGTTNLIATEKDVIGSLEDFEKFISGHATSKRVKLVQKNLTIKDLTSLPKPLILLNNDKNGFMILLETFVAGPNRVYQILNIRKKPVMMTEEELQKQWSGDAWYIDDLKQKKVLHESGGLTLQLSKSAYNFGLVEPSKQQASIKIKNISDMPIQIKKAKSSCSCTVVKPSDDTILQPSQEMELNFTVSLKKGKKGFHYSIAIPFGNLTNKASQVFKVEVMGNCDEIETMQDKLSNIKHELQLLRSDIKKVFAELESVKTAQAKLQKKKQVDTKIYDVVIGSSPVIGPQSAPVTIVEFFDFQCPYCIREWPKIKQVLQDYPEKIRLVFKHFPLSFHKKAKLVHAAVEFARREGGDDVFWKMHDMIISNSKKLDVATLREYTESLGLNLTDFDTLIANPAKMDELLQVDISEARKCKVRSTPTVLINGLKLTNRSRNGYKTRIDQILAKVDKSK